jgi:hypothetical protein
VFLDGRGVTFADGLIILGAKATLRGLSIGGFPGNWRHGACGRIL